MKSYEIVDGSRRDAKACARLDYDEKDDTYSIRISEDADPAELPAILRILADQGKREIEDRWARRWVMERVVPPSRQNLGSVLKENGLERYDMHALLVAGDGRCAQDDYFIRVVDSTDLRRQSSAESRAENRTLHWRFSIRSRVLRGEN